MLFPLSNSGTRAILQVRCPLFNFYVIRDEGRLFLLDAGFVAGEYFLMRELTSVGWDKHKITGIIVTHGHLDHILNVSYIAKKHHAWVAAPSLDLPHFQGQPKYAGWSKITGVLETIGRPTLGFKPFTPDTLLNDGDPIDICGGLQTIHLPGHTQGHSGFYLAEYKLLMSADLYASYGKFAHYPPAIFNSAPQLIPRSVKKALSLDLLGILPSHGDKASPTEHLTRAHFKTP